MLTSQLADMSACLHVDMLTSQQASKPASWQADGKTARRQSIKYRAAQFLKLFCEISGRAGQLGQQNDDYK